MTNNITEFLYQKLVNQYGEKLTKEIINGYKTKRYITVRVNTLKTEVSYIKKQFEINNIAYEEVSWFKDALVIKDAQFEKITNLDIYNNGEIYLQSLSSMLPPLILNPKPS